MDPIRDGERRRAFSTAGAAVVIFLGLMIALSTFYTVANNTSEQVGDAIKSEEEQQRELLQTAVEIRNVTYENGVTTVWIENTGQTTLSVNRTAVFVNGSYHGEENFRAATVSGVQTDVWTQGETLRVDLVTGQPRRVQVAVDHGVVAFTSVPSLIDGDELVFAQGDELASVADGRGISRSYGVTDAVVTGPMVENLRTEGVDEIPFVNGTGTVKLVDETGAVATLASGAGATPSRLFVGTWQGSPVSVFFVNATSGNIERVTPDGVTAVVASVSAEAVSGAADIDGDGADELIFGDTSQTLRYLDDDGTVVQPNAGYGSDVGIGLGEPADFDGDGTPRIPIVDGSNDLALVDDAGTTTALTGSGPAAKAPVGTFDWDRDGTPELVFVRTDGTLAYLDDVTGANTVETISEGGGSVTADEDTGAA
jgi:archaellum component FlaF (FlaF/FlaG flagellin family)